MFSNLSIINKQLIIAAEGGQLEGVRFLLDRGAAIDHPDRFGSTALTHAACNGHLKIIRLLLDRGATIDHPDDYPNCSGHTTLALAVDNGHKKVAEVIQEQIKEQQTYEGQKKEIKLFFLGKQVGEEKSAISSKPTFFLPKNLVGMIEDYLRPTSMPSQSRKRKL